MLRWLACLCLLGVAAAQTPTSLRVLFVGNSLTYTHDVPNLTVAMAKSQGYNLVVGMVAFPDFALMDHWALGHARQAISGGGWDYVVLQQGPSALPESRENLLQYVRLFARDIKAAKAKPALYMVWPSSSRWFDIDRSIESYGLAAQAVEGLLLPVGVAWKQARENHSLQLYADGLHPNPAGAYLAAAVILKTLFGDKLTKLPAKLTLPSGRVFEIEAALAERLRLIAVAVR